jgi:hypothetical protein
MRQRRSHQFGRYRMPTIGNLTYIRPFVRLTKGPRSRNKAQRSGLRTAAARPVNGPFVSSRWHVDCNRHKS